MRRHLVAVALVVGVMVLLLMPATAYAPSSGLAVEEQTLYQTGGTAAWTISGQVRNNDPTNGYTDVMVTMRWRDASNAQIGSALTFPASCRMLDSGGDLAPFSFPTGTPPSGWDHFDFVVAGKQTTVPRIVIGLTPPDPGPPFPSVDANGWRHWTPVTLLNDRAYTVSGLLAQGYEREGLNGQELTGVFKDAMSDPTQLSAVLDPSAFSAAFDLVGRNREDSLGTTQIFKYMSCEVVRYTPLQVYRFYNVRTGTHFYTADVAERDTVINTLGWLYHYEGPAYTVNEGSPSNSNPLYRFYNLRTGTHFYTADLAEANHIIATMASTFHFDGPAYNVSASQEYSRPVWRFYNYVAGTHFYTADAAERANVQTNLYHLYQYEGPAFNLAY
jgi:Repeat of unknown function (DUF5648)